MATTFYFHNLTNAASGTYPTGEQSAATPTWSMTGAATLKTMNTSKGTLQTSTTGTSIASNSLQNGFLGYYVSPPLNGAQLVGGGAMTLGAASLQTNTIMNFWVNSLNVYIWRPSTGTKVGTIRDAVGTSLGGTTTGLTETTQYITGITSSPVLAIIGDVVICEVWASFTSTMNTAYSATYYYDGTTDITTTNVAATSAASFISFAENLKFLTPLGPINMNGFSLRGGVTIN